MAKVAINPGGQSVNQMRTETRLGHRQSTTTTSHCRMQRDADTTKPTSVTEAMTVPLLVLVMQSIKQVGQLSQRNRAAGCHFWPKYSVVSLSEFFFWEFLLNKSGVICKSPVETLTVPGGVSAIAAHCGHVLECDFYLPQSAIV